MTNSPLTKTETGIWHSEASDDTKQNEITAH